MRIAYTALEVLAALLILSQMLYPAAFGLPLFPILRRKKKAALLDAMEEARAENEDEALAAELTHLKHHRRKQKTNAVRRWRKQKTNDVRRYPRQAPRRRQGR